MLWRNVVFDCCLELLLAEGRSSDALDFVIGKSSGQEAAHSRVVVVAQL